MPSTAFPKPMRRPALQASSAALALLFTATGAQAQTAGATANGAQALANTQTLRGGNTTANASEVAIAQRVAGDIDRSDVRVAGDSVTVAGTGNAAKLALIGAESFLGGTRGAELRTGPNGASATGNAAIASHQLLGTASVSAEIAGTQIAVAAKSVTSGKIALLDNAQDAAAIGNDLLASLTASDASSGITVSQAMDARSTVDARAEGGFAIVTGALSSSDIDASSNIDRASATGNSAASVLSLTAPAAVIDNGGEPATSVSMMSGGLSVAHAATATLLNQSVGGTIRAVASEGNALPAVAIDIAGDATGSSVVADTNVMMAIARGNVASTKIDFVVGSLASGTAQAGQPSSLAATVTVQKADDLDVGALSTGGTRVMFDANLTDSTVSVSQNRARTVATANDSESDLALTGQAFEAARGPGLATVDAAGLSIADAGAAVQNVQDYGASTILASDLDAKFGVSVSGALDRSMIGVEHNGDLVAAAGNNGATTITVSAGALDTSIAVNNLQTGNGDVTARSGETELTGGARITVDGSAANARLTVRANSFLTSAIGNLGSNNIAATATTVRGTSSGAVSGAIGDGYGAQADVALASNQKLGEPSSEGTLIPAIVSEVVTRTGIAADAATNSNFAVEDNSQQASAIGNSVANRLSLGATTLGETGQRATTSLASIQYGQAHVDATSDAGLLSVGGAGSTAALSGNSNIALALINDADNAVAVDAATAVGGGTSEAMSGSFASGIAQGDHLLSNQQFASGAANARVISTTTARGLSGDAAGASYRIADNHSLSEATANRALNAVSVKLADGAASAGISNVQVNAASVQASATSSTKVAMAMPATAAAIVIDGNATSALARGNAAENNVTLSSNAASAFSVGEAVTDPYGVHVAGGAALLNVQTNFSPVTASVADTSQIVPLNAGSLAGSGVSISANSIGASGYGNVAANTVSVTGAFAPPATIGNSQVNNGSVAAIVSSIALGGTAGSIGASNFSTSANQVSATATGNQVSSAITGLR